MRPVGRRARTRRRPGGRGRILAALPALALVLLAAPAHPGDPAGRDPAASTPAEAAGVDALPPAPSVAERLEEIRRRVQAAVEYPPEARRRELEGVATVGFEIDPAKHRARKVELVSTSGHTSLDRAAERSVVRAGTLPWVYGRVHIPVRFALE